MFFFGWTVTVGGLNLPKEREKSGPYGGKFSSNIQIFSQILQLQLLSQELS